MNKWSQFYNSVVICVMAMLYCEYAFSAVEYPPEQWLSGTLPVLYVNTDGCKPITSKTEYIAGSYYLDPNGVEGVQAFGSESSPLPLEIRGRGNASWSYASYRKKPYKMKLGKKASLMGMAKSKHWALMAHWEDGSVFLKDETGFEFSRRIGMAWTPRQRPVELVLNGEYMGLYFITENVRVENTRVNVVEQNDGETDPIAITGGWLLENDNYNDTQQIRMTAGNGELLRVTYKSPEILSTEQLSYLTDLIIKADSLVYVDDKWSRGWEDVIDMDALTAFYIVNEIVDNVEAFSGSCFMHKERGEDTKLVFGPVWDYGNSFGHMPLTLDCFLYENSPMRRHWITAVVQFPRFQQRVRQLWREKHSALFDTFADSVMAFTEPLRQAELQDGRRWERTYINNSLESRRTRYMNFINRKVAFLEQQWGQTTCTLAEAVESKDAAHIISDDLYVACLYDGQAYVTDNHGAWAAIVLDDKGDSITRNCKISGGAVEGYMATTSTNPTLLLDRVVENVVREQIAVIDTLSFDSVITLNGNTVVIIDGYYKGHAFWKNKAMGGNPLHVDVAEHLPGTCLDEGQYGMVMGILRKRHQQETDESLNDNSVSLQPNNDNYVFIPLEVIAKSEELVGDFNGDGRVDVMDVSFLIEVVLSNSPAGYSLKYDINGDGMIDVMDVSALIDIILSKGGENV